MSEEQINKSEENHPLVIIHEPILNEGKDDISKNDVNTPDEQPSPTEPQNQIAKTEPILVEIKKQKWSAAESINAIIAIGTVGAVIISMFSLNAANKSLELTKIAIDSANISSQKSYDVTKQFADASTKASNISDSNFNLSKKTLYKNDSTNRQFYQVTYQTALASQKSAEVAEKAFDEAKKEYEFSRQSAMAQNRSYVAINDMRMDMLNNDSIYNILIDIKNTGTTPASNVIIECSIVFSQQESRVLLPQLENNSNIIPIRYISAGQSITFPQSLNEFWEGKEMDVGFKRGYVSAFIYIKVRYTDVYNIEHYTRTFRRYISHLKQFIYCYNYNDAN